MSRDAEGRPTAPYDGGETPWKRPWARWRALQVARVALAILLGGLGGAALYILLGGP